MGRESEVKVAYPAMTDFMAVHHLNYNPDPVKQESIPAAAAAILSRVSEDAVVPIAAVPRNIATNVRPMSPSRESINLVHAAIDSSAESFDPNQPIYKGIVFVTSTREFERRYRLENTLGSGGFAVVKVGTDLRTGEKVAVKIVDKSRYAPGDHSLEREIQVLGQVRHPNCICLKEVYITPKKVFLITELVTGGELLDRLAEKGNYTEEDSSALIRQILDGVAYLHDLGIVHRDLKLENLLLENNEPDSRVKIADFGLSKFFINGDVLQTLCGSPQYVAPEVLDAGVNQSCYTPAVDMWSIGVILYILLSGFSPFDDESDPVLFQKIRRGDYSMSDPVWDKISLDAKEVVAALLTVDPELRLTAREALSLPWVKGVVSAPGTPTLSQTQDMMREFRARRASMRC
eukprot:jgi/Chlat1/7109/Chrsp57S06734